MRSRQLVDVKKDDGFAALHLASLNGHVQVGSYFRARFSLNHSLFVLFLLCFCFFLFFLFFLDGKTIIGSRAVLCGYFKQ